MAVAYLSDRVKHRFAFAVASICIAILIAVSNNRDLQYAALFLFCSGAFTAMPIVVYWFNMNLGGHRRRAVGSAWQVGFGNLGGIIAVYIFQEDGPRFVRGLSVSLAFAVLAVLACILYGLACWKANRDRRNAIVPVRELSEEERKSMGDLSPDYRYLL